MTIHKCISQFGALLLFTTIFDANCNYQKVYHIFGFCLSIHLIGLKHTKFSLCDYPNSNVFKESRIKYALF